MEQQLQVTEQYQNEETYFFLKGCGRSCLMLLVLYEFIIRKHAPFWNLKKTNNEARLRGKGRDCCTEAEEVKGYCRLAAVCTYTKRGKCLETILLFAESDPVRPFKSEQGAPFERPRKEGSLFNYKRIKLNIQNFGRMSNR